MAGPDLTHPGWLDEHPVTVEEFRRFVANFLFLPYYPFWSILVILLDIMIIWALLAYGRVIGSHEA